MTLNEFMLTGLNEMKNTDDIQKMIMEFGLTVNQAKVFFYLSKTGLKTASDISKNLKIPRTETYHLLNSLQQKGIVVSIIGKPTKFNSLSIEESLQILLNNEQSRLNDLNSKRSLIIQLWNTVPKYSNDEEIINSKFQTLQGKNSILVKFAHMVKNAKNEIAIIGSEADFIKLYHTDFIDQLKRTKANLKILTTFSEKGNYIFEKVPYQNLRKLNEINNGKFCFIIKDDEEVIFFLNNSNYDEIIAIWTDAKSFISTLSSLFALIWKKSPQINHDGSIESNISEDYTHRLKEIEQEKIILKYLNQKTTFSKKLKQ